MEEHLGDMECHTRLLSHRGEEQNGVEEGREGEERLMEGVEVVTISERVGLTNISARVVFISVREGVGRFAVAPAMAREVLGPGGGSGFLQESHFYGQGQWSFLDVWSLHSFTCSN